ncbi:oligoendopeptidase, M3 family [Pilibacter termitis]|uniref:Oligoendopeptidase, M3 family n=1 Tax=Pilibacter termitis TaxID=263852 RepID=A0A1T4NWB2_9ENTE|nr:M3 family oligoendopeptidase [Pilibacter termitis]SJZ83332.1 oligoendopeptidase, M3 family [Pilibacter termitis]
MKKFKDYIYKRPNYEEYAKKVRETREKFEQAKTVEEASSLFRLLLEEEATVESMGTLHQIHFSLNVNDEFHKKEDEWWNEYAPLFDECAMETSSALLKSPFVKELQEIFPKTLFLLAKCKTNTISETTLDLRQQENELISKYDELMANATIEFDGEVYNLPQMAKFMTDTNREVRKRADKARTAWYVQNEEQFDRIYDEMIKNRHQQAVTLGYNNYVEMSLDIRQRFGYSQKDIEYYRKQVLEVVVPVAQKLYARQGKRIGVEEMKHYDLDLQFLDGNATPQGEKDELVAAARKMYCELSKETGEFFDFMVERDLLDLDARKGKMGGGYCTYISDEKSPYIFANFNGTSGDVDVLTHEAGHAFQVYSSRHIQENSLIWPTIEAAEIFSMSMEFITWRWMESFFKEHTNRYKFSHLSAGVQFLPYGVLVDHFQQEVYTHTGWSAVERKATWRRLEKMYLPHKDYSESPDLERGIFWFKQAHIFGAPFYYIDYTLAQVVALQFWKKFNVEQASNAWEKYLEATSVGGTKTFLEIIELTGANSPFEKGTLREVIQEVDDYLSAISEKELALS